ncbi:MULTISPECIES: alpha/beta hydrolase [Metabacillus]|uniref:Esterase family protein n=1 Tax=Metabacillus hrfriensis TaxID=3048891 RepID=A0ACD4REX6_9BACI|nr:MULTISPECIES: esterase family protein [Metabacillus]UAL53381.1 esterase family protein [Metabacillus dongyingensis]USK29703.1 esterase family protein [Bacillus sp. CMF21]WHZ58947.1 esterase family protein [Metabacillus sp. CT-WN-B3]
MTAKAGIVKETLLYSKELEEEVTLLIYLPKNYSPLYKYSLIIAQDGQDYFRLGRISRQTEELLSEKEIENVIIVGIPYRDVHDRRDKYHPEGPKQKAYIRFLAHEVVPFLDKEFPTYQMGAGRALIGDSLAGTVSFMTALTYPNTFGKVIMQSPYSDETVLQMVEDFSSPALLSVYHQIGTKETEVKTTDGAVQDFLAPNRKLHAAIDAKGIPSVYEEFEGDHKWTFWQPSLKKILKTMF